MEAADTQDGSYAWKSILIGKEILKEGMRWRVGDRTSIRVWSDPWLPSNFLPYISTPNTQGMENMLVASSIDRVLTAGTQKFCGICFCQGMCN